LPILWGELAEFGGQPCQCVARPRGCPDPFTFVALVSYNRGLCALVGSRRRGDVLVVIEGVGGLWRRAKRSGFEGAGVCVFGFAGASTGASGGRR